MLAVGFGGGKDISFVELWDLDRGERLAVMPGTTDLPNFVTTIPPESSADWPSRRTAAPGGQLWIAVPTGCWKVGNFAGRFTTFLPAASGAGWRAQVVLHRGHIFPDGSRLASGSYDGTAILWDTKNWTSLHVLDNLDPRPTWACSGF